MVASEEEEEEDEDVMEEGVIVAVEAEGLDIDFCEELVSVDREKIEDGVEDAVVVLAPKTDEF